MSLHNEDIAAAFDEMADLLAIQGENAFRIRAYRGAAQVVRSLARELAEMGGAKAFDALPGIGTDLAGKIEELLETGNIHALEKLRKSVSKRTVPPSMPPDSPSNTSPPAQSSSRSPAWPIHTVRG